MFKYIVLWLSAAATIGFCAVSFFSALSTGADSWLELVSPLLGAGSGIGLFILTFDAAKK